MKKIPVIIKSEGSINCVPDTSTISPQENVDSEQMDFGRDYEEIRLRDLAKEEDPVELIVGLNSKVSNAHAQVEAIATKCKGRIKDVVSNAGKIVAVVVNITSDQARSFMSDVEAMGISTYVEPNHKFRALWVPNDPYWQYQWGPKTIQADWAWNTTVGNSSLLIAVIDSGIDYTHPDLAPNYNASGLDWVNNDNDPRDDRGHGTHCAGIIAAKLNNSIGIAGTAQVKIMAEKVLDQDGWGDLAWVANGIYHATNMGAKIISMSLGDYRYSYSLYSAIKYAYEKGVLLIAAAGNEAVYYRMYPASFDEVIAVTATDQNDTLAYFTNFGKWVEVAAPGVNIYSTMPTYDVTLTRENYTKNYSNMSGTSMAAPFVAGVAGLIWSRFPSWTRDRVRIHLRKTANDSGTPGFDIYFGYGRVNAKKAVENPPQNDLVILNWNWTRTPYVTMGNVTVNATILNYGMNNTNNVVVQLWLNGTLKTSKSITSIASGQSATVSLSSPAPGTGVYNVTMRVVPVTGEVDTTDNVVWGYVGTEEKIIKVPDIYPTIQEAVNVVVSGDTIKVAPKSYYETVCIVGRHNISLIGQWPTNITLLSVGPAYTTIYVCDSSQIFISGLEIYAGRYGIRLYYSNNITLSSNYIIYCKYGIRLEYSNNTTVSGNDISLCNYGILLEYSNNTAVSGNTIQNCDNGTVVYYCSNNKISRNKVKVNRQYAIQLFGTGTNVTDNHFRGNNIGIRITNATGNRIYHNNFINNTVQVNGTLPNIWCGRWNVTGNYWSNYTGTDPDGDGIGNTPHIINANNKDFFPFMNPYLPGDINHDGKVDILDVSIISEAWQSYPGHPKWNPRADLNEDAIVNINDLYIVSANFDKTWQSYWGE